MVMAHELTMRFRIRAIILLISLRCRARLQTHIR